MTKTASKVHRHIRQPRKVIKAVKRARDARIPKHARTLEKPDGTYRFVVGRKHVVVWTPYDEKHVVSHQNVLGFSTAVMDNLYANGGVWIHPVDVSELIDRDFKPRVVEGG